MIPELPNKLFSNGRSVLAKFGYKHFEDGESRNDWADMWDLLRGDFPIEANKVPAFNDMDASMQEAAQHYMKIRLLADHYLDECERLHVAIFKEQIGTDLVEEYAVARDRYEHSVEGFGDAREKLQPLLQSAVA